MSGKQDVFEVAALRQELDAPPYEDIVLTGDGVISADYHFPFASLHWVRRIIADLKRHRHAVLYIIGDLIDLAGLSQFYLKKTGDHAVIKPEVELSLTEMVMKEVERWASRIYWIAGNHDLRLAERLHNGIAWERVVGLLRGLNQSKWFTTEHTNAYIGKMRVTHPKAYSKIRVRTPYFLAEKYGCDIISTHGHHAGLSYSSAGHLIVEPGCVADQARVGWANKSDTAHPIWNNGYVILDRQAIIPRFDGYAHFEDA